MSLTQIAKRELLRKQVCNVIKRLTDDPDNAEVTIETKCLKALLLKTGGRIVIADKWYEIQKKSLGVGIYRIWLKKN
jgi:hypothetical protein